MVAVNMVSQVPKALNAHSFPFGASLLLFGRVWTVNDLGQFVDHTRCLGPTTVDRAT